jgi:hypothetical protein
MHPHGAGPFVTALRRVAVTTPTENRLRTTRHAQDSFFARWSDGVLDVLAYWRAAGRLGTTDSAD